MRDPRNDSELIRRFHATAASSLPRAPLNAALCTIIGRDPELAGMLAHAPITQQQPVLMLAAIHHLLLDEPDQRLAEWYPNLTTGHHAPDDPRLAAELRTFVLDRAPVLLDLLATRRTQTNEVGRCGLFLALFDIIACDVETPLAHIDVGTSGGLNLLLPQFAYRYDDDPVIGDSTVQIDIGTRGTGPRPTTIPTFTASCGIDTAPIDVTDPTEARWLEACCWPDQADRFHRLRMAIDLAREHPPEIFAGDAVESIRPVVERMAGRGHPVVTTSWVLSYLTGGQRTAFVEALAQAATTTDISWVIAESPILTPEIPHSRDHASEHITELTLVTWRNGEQVVRHLGTCHPHGYWINWA
jgi:hypothetical protein